MADDAVVENGVPGREPWVATTYDAEAAMAVFEGGDWRTSKPPEDATDVLEGMRDALTVAAGEHVDDARDACEHAEAKLRVVHEAAAGVLAGTAPRVRGSTDAEYFAGVLDFVQHETEVGVPSPLQAMRATVDHERGRAEEAEAAVARAHAAIKWVATVRGCILNGLVEDRGPRADKAALDALAVAHAVSEVWLADGCVTAAAVADVLGWHGEWGPGLVADHLTALRMHGPTPPLVNEDLQPVIEVRS